MKALFVLGALIALMGCAAHPVADNVKKIVVSHTDCGTCDWDQAAFYSDGRFAVSGDDEINGRRPTTEFRELTRMLSDLHVFDARTNIATDSSLPKTYLWIEDGKHTWQSVFPTSLTPTRAADDLGRLQRFDQFATQFAQSVRRQALLPAIAQARHYERLRTVVFRSLGCFGSCPSYVARFSSDGSATLEKAHRFAGDVPFARVREAARSADIATLRHHYRMRAMDTYGVAFEFRYADGLVYTINAPDDQSWDTRLAFLVGEFRQLVEDSNWSSR